MEWSTHLSHRVVYDIITLAWTAEAICQSGKTLSLAAGQCTHACDGWHQGRRRQLMPPLQSFRADGRVTSTTERIMSSGVEERH